MELFFLVLLIVMLALALGSGYPAAFAIPGSAILTIVLAALCGYVLAGDADAFFVHGGGADSWLSAGVMNFRGVYRLDDRDTLIAIPLFIFMGHMLQRSRVAEDLLLAMARLFGAMRGGLGISAVLVGALLAATTSVIGATVVAMGMIALPTMLQNRYSKPLATGTIAATGTLGQIIPPSIVLLILVHQLTTAVNQANAARRALYKTVTGDLLMPSQFDVPSVSAGEMFMGALMPGLMLVALYIVYIAVSAFLRPDMAPTVSRDKQGRGNPVIEVLSALVPPLVLIFLVLGSIVAGVATVNQAGAIGAAGATVMAGYRLHEGRRGAYAPTLMVLLSLCALAIIVGRFNVNLRKIDTSADIVAVILAAIASASLAFALGWSAWRTFKIDRTLQHVVAETTKTTSLVFAILLGAVMLTAAFRAFGGQDLVRVFLQQLPGGFWAQFAIAMAIIFVLGFFLDFIEISVVVVPIIAPILLAEPSVNVTAVWLGVMIALNVQTSFLTPPFGFALFYLRGVAPMSVNTIDIYKGVVPFIALQLVALCLVGAYPRLVNYLPTRVLMLSDAAPPPTNPALQYCLENYTQRAFQQRGGAIRQSIRDARKLDLGVLPQPYRDALTASFGKAESAFAAMEEIGTAVHAIAMAEPSYRPLHARVRKLESDARRLETAIARLQVIVSRAGGAVTQAAAERARQRILDLTAQRDALLAQVPASWPATHETFAKILQAESNARHQYRRMADDAYEPLAALLAAIGDADKLAALGENVRGLEAMLAPAQAEEPPSTAQERMADVLAALRRTAGAGDIAGAVSQARRALRANVPDLKAARQSLAEAVRLLDGELGWRARAASSLLPDLMAYRDAIADTIGLRGQSRLPDSVAAGIAACSAKPRDIFLNF